LNGFFTSAGSPSPKKGNKKWDIVELQVQSSVIPPTLDLENKNRRHCIPSFLSEE